MPGNFHVYLEIGSKRTFAGALDWPGWCRYGGTEEEALAALFEYGPRYARVLAGTRLGFAAPKKFDHLAVVERLEGDVTTDLGAIHVPPSVDRDRSFDDGERRRFEKILRAGWRALDEAVGAARGKTLAAGPRGGGRTLTKIVEHVVEADAAYLGAVGWKAPRGGTPEARLAPTRDAILAALVASATGAISERGPRGGVRWTGRWLVRRVASHVISHAWEIERRAGLWQRECR
jgi:hypothetical protein